MHKTNLRKVGGSIMLAVPPAFLDQLHLQAGATVGLAINHGCLVVSPNPRPRYTLAELLAASDYSQPQPTDEREWVDTLAVRCDQLRVIDLDARHARKVDTLPTPLMDEVLAKVATLFERSNASDTRQDKPGDLA